MTRILRGSEPSVVLAPKNEKRCLRRALVDSFCCAVAAAKSQGRGISPVPKRRTVEQGNEIPSLEQATWDEECSQGCPPGPLPITSPLFEVSSHGCLWSSTKPSPDTSEQPRSLASVQSGWVLCCGPAFRFLCPFKSVPFFRCFHRH